MKKIIILYTIFTSLTIHSMGSHTSTFSSSSDDSEIALLAREIINEENERKEEYDEIITCWEELAETDQIQASDKIKAFARIHSIDLFAMYVEIAFKKMPKKPSNIFIVEQGISILVEGYNSKPFNVSATLAGRSPQFRRYFIKKILLQSIYTNPETIGFDKYNPYQVYQALHIYDIIKRKAFVDIESYGTSNTTFTQTSPILAWAALHNSQLNKPTLKRRCECIIL